MWVIIRIIVFFKKNEFLLADVFEKFIDTCLNFYGLNPYHYFSSHGVSWDAMVKMAGVKFQKISDIDKYLLIEKGLRTEISYTAKVYEKANNKYSNDYDSKKLLTLIPYLDMNNLYGWAMREYLAYVGFMWLRNVVGFDVNSISAKSLIGYFLEVKLEYPNKLQELHNDYPLSSETFAVSSGILS